MSVRKRNWLTRRGEAREAWIVDYVDQHGKRGIKTFKLKKEADAFAARSRVEVGEGTHVKDSASITVAEAGLNWIKSAENADPPLEPTSIDQYRQHLRVHIVPFIGREKLSKITVPFVRAFEERLHETGRSGTMVRYVVRSLGSILTDAQERGHLVRNPVREMRKGRRTRGSHGREKRGHALEVGRDIPTPDEIRAVIKAASGRYRPLLLTAIFTGLRSSELRGLRWADIDLKALKLRVTQRADRRNRIGAPKTKAARREIDLPPSLASELREWKLRCPIGDLDLAFPNSKGAVDGHPNIVKRGLVRAFLAAGVTRVDKDESGQPVVVSKYTGLHALRHFYASWCANQGLSMKQVQGLMGHSNIAVTMDTYTHLFKSDESTAEKLAQAERALRA